MEKLKVWAKENPKLAMVAAVVVLMAISAIAAQ
jgi:hypothetical protein